MANLTWKTEKRKLGDLVAYENNPRILTDKEKKDLVKSLKKFNLVEIPAINQDNMIIAGHQRIKILSELYGPETEIEVRVPDRMLSEDEFKEYLIRSNKNTGEWDFLSLKENFEIDDLVSWGFDLKDFPDIEGPKDEDLPDLELKETFEVVCSCENEEEQEALFQRLSEEGIKCRILTS